MLFKTLKVTRLSAYLPSFSLLTSEHITWIQDILTPALTSPLPPSLSLDIQFYITSSSTTTSSTSSIADADPEKWADSDSNSNEATGSNVPSGRAQLSGTETEKAASALLALPFVRVERGRPNVEPLLQGEIAAATGRVSVNGASLTTYAVSHQADVYGVLVCGTHDLAESVRVALRTPRPMDILRGGPSVTLHVEAFGGAVCHFFD